MIFEFGDVLLVPFPFTDQSTTKQRPAVVVSSAAYGRERPDVIVMAITSQVRSRGELGEVVLQRWAQAGLIKPSLLKPLIATVERGMVRRRLGRLENDDLEALRVVLRSILGD